VPTVTNSVQEFMQSYRAAWERRDLDEIVTMYGLPMLALQADGSRHCLHDEAECRQFFGAALDRYAATGFEAAELVVDDVIAAGRKVMLVAATWTLKREPGIVLMSARFTYNVRDGGDGWKIYASTPHEA
jgi:ketosteroid isomerase-like protein